MTTQTEMPGAASPTLTVLQLIGRTYHDIMLTFEEFMGMSAARWQVLSLLSREDVASQAIIAQRLHVDGAAITRQVKQLEAEGLITRRADPKDNRYTQVALSGEGRRLVEALRAKRELFEASAAKELSE